MLYKPIFLLNSVHVQLCSAEDFWTQLLIMELHLYLQQPTEDS